jgi:CRISPR type III-B/RAMP module RAMP protein Cmr6
MIAQAADTRRTLGDFASNVENRSLLFEKYVLAKSWGHEAKFNDANRFNVIRATTGGRRLLNEAAQESEGRIRGRNTQAHVREQHEYRKKVALGLAHIGVDDASLVALRVKSSLTFLGLLEKSYPERHRTFVGELGGRLLINLAGGVQENAGISLDRCFGLPLIPGSAVKGVSRHHALWEIRTCEDQSERKNLLRMALLTFGYGSQDLELKKKKAATNWAWAVEDSQELLQEVVQENKLPKEFKGLISFLPATPASEKNLRIVAEGITPHTVQTDNPKTNQSAGEESQHLTPLAFPAVERGSQFAFSLILNRELAGVTDPEYQVLLETVLGWLKGAVTGTGIGAKTSAGFGWFSIDEEAAEKRKAEAEALAQEEARKAEALRQEQAAQAAEEERVAQLSPLERHIEQIERLEDQQFAGKAKDVIAGKLPEDEVRAFFKVLQSSSKKDRRKQWKKKKEAEFWTPLKEAAAKFNIEIS